LYPQRRRAHPNARVRRDFFSFRFNFFEFAVKSPIYLRKGIEYNRFQEGKPMFNQQSAEKRAPELRGKVAIVTGAASGIGRAVAILYAQMGAQVTVSDVDEAGGLETVSQIAEVGGQAQFVKANVAMPEDDEMLVAKTVERFGRLDIACNNAGIGGTSAPVGEYPPADWDKVIAINLSGVFYGMRYQIPAMLTTGGGAIVNMASILGWVGFANASAYVAAKHGVLGLTKAAALEYSAQGIRVNAVGPAFIRTPMIGALEQDQAMNAMLVGLHPIGRLGESQEVAELVAWLSSERASFVTGSYYPVDGGYLAQ
jgi:NAD(P)-dependent dehydrogenase (short-subunit alcohol dehydrogenase family)